MAGFRRLCGLPLRVFAVVPVIGPWRRTQACPLRKAGGWCAYLVAYALVAHARSPGVPSVLSSALSPGFSAPGFSADPTRWRLLKTRRTKWPQMKKARRNRQALINLVAGAGFEPTTFGL